MLHLLPGWWLSSFLILTPSYPSIRKSHQGRWQHHLLARHAAVCALKTSEWEIILFLKAEARIYVAIKFAIVNLTYSQSLLWSFVSSSNNKEADLSEISKQNSAKISLSGKFCIGECFTGGVEKRQCFAVVLALSFPSPLWGAYSFLKVWISRHHCGHLSVAGRKWKAVGCSFPEWGDRVWPSLLPLHIAPGMLRWPHSPGLRPF